MSTLNSQVTVAVTGAAGQIGYALLFRIASGQMFGPEMPVNLHILELSSTASVLEGIAMELEDCAFPLLRNIMYGSDPKKAMSDVNWAILVGAAPRKAGMERADLLKINSGIFKEQAEAINEKAAQDVRVFVVGNPCNTNALITSKHAPDIPKDRFYAMTLLDQHRAVSQLAKKGQVPVTDIRRLAIWGNHSSTQYPDFYNAQIKQAGTWLPVPEVIKDEAWLQNDFISCVQQRGAAVIAARGASSAASAANAILGSVYRLTHDTPEGECFSVARCSQGEYGIDEGLMFSYPCFVKRGILNVVPDLLHQDFGHEKLRRTLEELRTERKAIKEAKE